MFLRNCFLILVIFGLFNLIGCKDKKADSGQVLTKPIARTAAQDSAYRKKFMYAKSKYPDLLPLELIPFIQSPFVAHSFEETDINQDGLKDYILLLVRSELNNENPPEGLEMEPAPTWLLLRQKDKTLKIHSKNESAFTLEALEGYVPIEVGIYGDSLGNGFHFYSVIQGAGATASYSNATYHFVLDKKSDKFYLAETTLEDGFVSPGGAQEFMLEKARRSAETGDLSYDTVAIKENDYEPTITTEKWKVGEQWFSDFKFVELDPEEENL